MTTWPKRRRREPGKLTWRCRNRLSLSSAWFAPLNRGSLNSAHIHGTDVPVEEPSTASNPDIAALPIIAHAGSLVVRICYAGISFSDHTCRGVFLNSIDVEMSIRLAQ